MFQRQILKEAHQAYLVILICSQFFFSKPSLSIPDQIFAISLVPHVEEDTSWRGMDVQKEYIECALPFIYNAPCCTVHSFTSEDRNWKENSRDQTDKVNQKTTIRHAPRCREILPWSSSLFSTPPPFFFFFHTSPWSKHAAVPVDFSCHLLKTKRGRWAEGDPGREQRNGRKNRWQALTKGRTLC